MKKISKLFLGVAIPLFCFFIRTANAENFDYVEPDTIEGNTTRTPISTSAEEKKLLSDYPDMNDYTGKYVIPGLVNTLSKDPSNNRYSVAQKRYVPQGICVAGQYLLITAYDSKHILNSVIYVMKASDNTYITTLILPTTSHCGGLAYDTKNSYIWVCDGNAISGFSYKFLNTQVTNAINPQTGMVEIKAIDLLAFPKHFTLSLTASFCTFFDGRLWVGEFGEKEEKESYGYNIDLVKGEATIDFIMEVPKKAQGMVFYKNGTDIFLFVSTSYGRYNDSYIYIYKTSYSNPKAVSGKTYKRIYKNTHINKLTFLPMSEGITVSGSMLYIVFESGAYVYQEDNSILHDPKPFGEYLRYNIRNYIS